MGHWGILGLFFRWFFARFRLWFMGFFTISCGLRSHQFPQLYWYLIVLLCSREKNQVVWEDYHSFCYRRVVLERWCFRGNRFINGNRLDTHSLLMIFIRSFNLDGYRWYAEFLMFWLVRFKIILFRGRGRGLLVGVVYLRVFFILIFMGCNVQMSDCM
jgi:hypothetical protein